MDRIHPHFTVRTSFALFLLILLQMSTDAQPICSAPVSVEFAENNLVDAVVATITVKPNVVLDFKPPPDNPNNPFLLRENQLIAARVLDYETVTTHVTKIICTETVTSARLDVNIIVLVTNVNDNDPFFDHNLYQASVNEFSPIGTTVGRFPAKDLDMQTIYYTLLSDTNSFELLTETNPEIFVSAHLDYDNLKSVELKLMAQDTRLKAATASTTIMVTILDVDNRPPWFEPCTKHAVGMTVVCQSAGYTGTVNLNEQETGVLPLKPGPLYAIDGDSGINEEIEYSILSGDGDGLFAINQNTGNITMLKPAVELGTITLTVLAVQKMNSFMFATTTVAISVQVKSLHPPQFQRPQYEAVVTGVGTMAMDPKNKDEPLHIIATDDDYIATGGINPHITYYVNGSSDFTIIDGYLFMVQDLPASTLSLQVVAVDSLNDDSTTAELSVEVISGLTTTTLPLSTTDSMATGVSTINSKTTEADVSTTKPSVSTHSSISTSTPSTTSESIISTSTPSTTSESIISTSTPSTTSESIISTTHSSLTTEATVSTMYTSMTTGATVSASHTSSTSEGSISTASTAQPVSKPHGGYRLADMAAIGGTLGALLLVSLVVISVLICRIWRGKADWRKIYETSMFRSSLGQGSGGEKEAIQYINDAFQHDEDEGSVGFGGPKGGDVMAADDPWRDVKEFPPQEPIVTSPLPLYALPNDDTSQADSGKADSEKEVKPILTKERRMDEGYKSVWFKEDIDPDAKEEVLIIPDSRDDDEYDADLDPAEDSEGDEKLAVEDMATHM